MLIVQTSTKAQIQYVHQSVMCAVYEICSHERSQAVGDEREQRLQIVPVGELLRRWEAHEEDRGAEAVKRRRKMATQHKKRKFIAFVKKYQCDTRLIIQHSLV
jgi:hypothetical protein